MYVGRIVAAGLTAQNKLAVMYRVSSRSYPSRTILPIGEALAVVPKPGFEADVFKSPFIAYNCLRKNGRYAVVGNGTQVDPVFEKLETGMSVRDALISVLYGLDYEHDERATPRIVAVVDRNSREVALAVIRPDGLEVKILELGPGQYLYLSTYEHNGISIAQGGDGFEIGSAEDGCAFVMAKGVFAGLTHPIASAAAFESDTGFDTACLAVSPVPQS